MHGSQRSTNRPRLMKSKDLLRKYIERGLTQEERFELEKRALEDAFLSDAWEGLQVEQKSNLAQRWKLIEQEWDKHNLSKHSPKIIAIRHWLPYAAVAATILALLAIVFLFRSNEVLQEQASTLAIETSDLSGEASPIPVDIEEVEKEAKILDAAQQSRTIAQIEKITTHPEEVHMTNAQSTKVERIDKQNKVAYAKQIRSSDVLSDLNQEQAETIETPVAIKTSIKRPIRNEEVSSTQAIAYTTDKVGEEGIGQSRSLAISKPSDQKVLSINDKQPRIKKLKARPQTVLSQKTSVVPRIGIEAFEQLINKHGLTNEEAFLLGLQSPIDLLISFDLDDNDMPINIEIAEGSMAPVIIQRVIKLLKESGQWDAEGRKQALRYSIKLPIHQK